MLPLCKDVRCGATATVPAAKCVATCFCLCPCLHCIALRLLFLRLPLLLLLFLAPGDVACDMYHKYADDFKMMKQMGIKHYRCVTEIE